MTERNISMEILEGLKEIKAYKSGKVNLKIREIKESTSSQAVREKLNLSLSAFAGIMGISLRTVQDWEQGRRKPSGPAKSLLQTADRFPEIFRELEPNE